MGLDSPYFSEIFEALVRALGEQNNRISEKSANVLIEIGQGSVEVIDALILALEGKDDKMRERITEVLGKIRRAREEEE